MPRPRPPYLHREVTRHGKTTWYVRVGKGPRIRIHGAFGTPEFYAAYEAARSGQSKATRSKTPAGSLAWLVERYRESAAWVNLSPATRRQRENILRHVLESAGTIPFSAIKRRDIVAGRDRRRDTPAAAKHFLQTLRGLFDWAEEAEYLKDNPTRGVKIARKATEGYHVWTEEECRRFESRWPLGTRERLAYDILFYTGLRRGDAVQLGRPHVREGVATIRTEKTGEIVSIPLAPALQRSIEAARDFVGELTYLATKSGRPWKKESFGNWFRKACEAAGVPGSAHGLRKARATHAANSGASEAQLDAMFGWRGGRMAALYTKNANRRRLAEDAARFLDRNENIHSRTQAQGAGNTSK
jgi:integrase